MLLEPAIHTARLALRSLSSGDITQDYCNWLNDPTINQFLEARFTRHSIESLQNYVEAMNASPADLLMGIFEKGQHIGNVKIGPIDPHHQHGSIGLLIGNRSAWGKGYATEVVRAVTQYAIQNLNLYKMVAGCYSSNIASYKAFIKAGYAEESRLKEYWVLDGHREDHLQLGITAVQWQAQKQ